MRARFLVLGLMLLGLSCTQDSGVLVPDYNAAAVLDGATALPPEIMRYFDGIYEVVEGNGLFGQQVALKWNRSVLSLYSGKDAMLCEFECGARDTMLLCVGYWRKMVNTETGTLRGVATVARDSTGQRFGLPPRPGDIVFNGVYSQGDGNAVHRFALRYLRPLFTGARPFYVIAHRAGGRNSDYLPASENSVELLLLAERFGANAVEIDVQSTSDGVPVIYHDAELNLRLTQKTGLVGAIGDYTYAQVQTFVRLLHGERIPTLRQMLSAALHRTTLQLVWLDTKPGMPVATLQRIQREYRDSARIYNRSLEILIGLPSEGTLAEFQGLPGYASTPSICELEPDRVRAVNAAVWAPRWTLGTQNGQVAALQAEGRRAFVWTMDQTGYIATFLRDGSFDGMVTNYPSLVAFLAYAR
jgi:glycerophosphoryl diester phosphodiesterase